MIIVYTDGSCLSSWNLETSGQGGLGKAAGKGIGGWAWWIAEHHYDSGGMVNTTNNQMEMLAVTQALWSPAIAADDDTVMIVSDSSYVVDGMSNRWYEGWQAKATGRTWRNAAGKPVANQSLWEDLIRAHNMRKHAVYYRHVRGHGRGDEARQQKDAPYKYGNQQADKLAGQARAAEEIKLFGKRAYQGLPEPYADRPKTYVEDRQIRPASKGRPALDSTDWERDSDFCGP